MPHTPYTIKIHVQCLKIIMGYDDPCSYCPVGVRYGSLITSDRYNNGEVTVYIDFVKEFCTICRKFVGLRSSVSYITKLYRRCPCKVLGKEQAINRTLLAIEEYELKVKSNGRNH